MAIRTTNITALLVGEVIDSRTTQVGASCVRPNINRWSKYKPVRGSWPASANGKYGLDLADNWAYLAPRGTPYDEPLRIGDFRGYQHDLAIAFPTIVSRDEDKTIPANLTPCGETPTAKWRVRCYNEANAGRVTPSDLGLSSYYVGIKVTGADGGPHYKTWPSVSQFNDIGAELEIDVRIGDAHIPTYVNCPYAEGTLTFTLVLCSSAVTQWSSVAPATVIELPALTHNGVVYSKTSVISLLGWLKLYPDQNWEGVQYQWGATTLTIITAFVYGTTGTEFAVASKPSWMTVKVYTGGGIEDTGDNSYPVEYQIRMYPTANNTTSEMLSGSVVISSANATITIPVSQLAGVPEYGSGTGVLTATAETGATWTLEGFTYQMNMVSKVLDFSFAVMNYSAYGGPMHYEMFLNQVSLGFTDFPVAADEITNELQFDFTAYDLDVDDDIDIVFHAGYSS